MGWWKASPNPSCNSPSAAWKGSVASILLSKMYHGKDDNLYSHWFWRISLYNNEVLNRVLLYCFILWIPKLRLWEVKRQAQADTTSICSQLEPEAKTSFLSGRVLQMPSGTLPVLVWAAITKYRRLGGLEMAEIHFSHCWSLEVWDHAASMVKYLVRTLLGCRVPNGSRVL